MKMKKSKPIQSFALVFLLFSNSGCISLSYINDLAQHQARILRSQESIEKVLAEKKYDEKTREYLILAKEVLAFVPKLGLQAKGNYQDYVQLKNDSVSYVVNAAEKFRLQGYQWNYPIVGKLPYKGFPEKEDALKEAEKMKNKGFDVYVRGVSAYSTLGWFKDPIFSSMLSLPKEAFVETLIHEIVHANYFKKGDADYNEQLASFIGYRGALKFFEERGNKTAIEKLQAKWHDAKIFSDFIAHEISDLRNWYDSQKDLDEEGKNSRLQAIQKRFAAKVIPLLKSESYKAFAKIDLNNARLLLFGTYMKEVAAMERDFAASGLSLKEWFLREQESK
tara:strand:+ start:6619 stop:7623 length:1005 start_codon:yes stop_codon:yes gene_type:complete